MFLIFCILYIYNVMYILYILNDIRNIFMYKFNITFQLQNALLKDQKTYFHYNGDTNKYYINILAIIYIKVVVRISNNKYLITK